MKKYNARQTSFARALPDSETIIKAATAAGYSPKSNKANKLARKEDFKAFVASLKLADEEARSDLQPVIAALMAGAEAAMESAKKSGSGATFNAARSMLAEAARLKQKLPKKAQADALKDWARHLSPEVDRVAAAARSAG